MKGPTRTVESHSTKKKPSPLPQSYDEAKASCKARKRKERQESISSLCQERKVIRSNSEERPTPKKHPDAKPTMRRVSSSEDFKKTDAPTIKSLTAIRTASPDLIPLYDENCENEKRRNHERFLKPMLVKGRKGRRPKAKLKAKFGKLPPEGAKFGRQPVEGAPEAEVKTERSPSPLDRIDLSKLHEQIDCAEPLLSFANDEINDDTETMPGLSVATNRLLSSPRNSIIATHRIYLDPDVQQANFGLEKERENALDLKLVKMTKQINSIKKRIKKYESEFEGKHGYKVSHADKMNDKSIRKLYMELSKLKKEQKQLDVGPGSMPGKDDGFGEENKQQGGGSGGVVAQFEDTIIEIEKRLGQKRDSCSRSTLLDQMSFEELTQEKIAVQKALLYLESVHGRPDHKDHRNLARPFYDRYRLLKRMILKNQPNQTGNELATIHEDETMNFVPTITPQVSEVDSERSSVVASTDSSDTETSSSISENLHGLTKYELLEQHRLIIEEKKDLRRTIKLFELDFQHKNGRMVQKEDRLPIEDVYVSYKKVKAKLKLLDALVGKQL